MNAYGDTVGTLQVNDTFHTKFYAVDCPAGASATSECYRQNSAGHEVVHGLGEVTTAHILVFDGLGSDCGHLHAQIPIVVPGKGEIDLTMTSASCISITHYQLTQFPPTEVKVSGGSGRYAGASGSGILDYENSYTASGGDSMITWTGTLNVAGLTFDTTPPQIVGAKSKVVKTRAAAGARVRYSASATDATDGPVRPACLPKSGSVFRVGRTTVSCTSVDSSGNTANARFVITVKRVH